MRKSDNTLHFSTIGIIKIRLFKTKKADRFPRDERQGIDPLYYVD